MNRYESLSAVRGSSSGIHRIQVAVLLAAGVGLTAAAAAAPQALNARQNPTESSTFTLDFGDFGGERQANISTTQFQLVVDADAGTARFTNYLQHIDPILLPGDVSTGNITVVIEPGAEPGTYVPETGAFSSTDTYAIYFEEDLSQFGLESPVRLDSTSSGTVTFSNERSGLIDLGWQGRGELGQTGITFDYTCEVATIFGIRTIPPVQAEPAEVELRAGTEGDSASNGDDEVEIDAMELESAAEESAAE